MVDLPIPHSLPLDVPLLDLQILHAIRAMVGDQMVSCIIEQFLEDAVQVHAQIDQALETANTAQLVYVAHCLRSSSANLGAVRLSKLCGVLETLAQQGVAPPFQDYAPALATTVAESRKALTSFLSVEAASQDNLTPPIEH